MRAAPLLRACLLAVVTVALAGPACGRTEKREGAATTDRATVFTKRGPAKGDRHEEAGELTLSVPPRLSLRETSKRTEEVLATAGGAVTRARVRFEAVAGERSSPVRGRAYVAALVDGGLDVHDERGGAASDAEAAEVRRLLPMLGRPDPLFAALPATPLERGARVEPMETAFAARMKDLVDGATVSDVAVAFREAVGDEGVFDVALKLARREADFVTTMSLKGELRVSTRTGMPGSMDLEGPVTSASTTGTARLRLTRRPL